MNIVDEFLDPKNVLLDILRFILEQLELENMPF